MSMARRVVVGREYRYEPVQLDVMYRVPVGSLQAGDIVTVIEVPGCPAANTMGMCYVSKDGEFCGAVMTNSLQPSLRETLPAEVLHGE